MTASLVSKRFALTHNERRLYYVGSTSRCNLADIQQNETEYSNLLSSISSESHIRGHFLECLTRLLVVLTNLLTITSLGNKVVSFWVFG